MKYTIAFFLFVMCSATQISCNSSTEKEKAPKEKIAIEDKGVKIDYTDTGKGDTVLLFVHGWCINKEYWTSQENYFKDRYRIVKMDLPGFGASGKNRTDWSVENYGKDVYAVMQQLDLKNVILIGHSMSGDVVLAAAATAPERVIGLVGIDNFKGVGVPEDSASKKDYAAAMQAMRKDFKGTVSQFFNQSLFSKTTDTIVKLRVMNDVFSADTSIAIACMEPNDFNEVANLKMAKKKLYMINSDIFPTDTSGLVANKLAYEILYTPGTGHYSMIENPAAFNDRLDKIITDISSQRK